MVNNKKLEQEIAVLKQQLEEKEKELHYKNCECEKWKADYENCSKLEKIMTKERQYCLDNWRASEQNNISFAVEQLEKVKEIFIQNVDAIGVEYKDDCCFMLSLGWVKKVIKNQIAELTQHTKNRKEEVKNATNNQ